MKAQTTILIVTGAIIGALLSEGIDYLRERASSDNTGTSTQSTMSMDHNMGGGATMSMKDMKSSLESKTGDEFDRAFISMMIEHHQGAIDMAKLAETQAAHQEIKSMSAMITEAQAKEIEQMKDWQKQWGY